MPVGMFYYIVPYTIIYYNILFHMSSGKGDDGKEHGKLLYHNRGIYWGYIWIMEKKMDTTIECRVLSWQVSYHMEFRGGFMTSSWRRASCSVGSAESKRAQICTSPFSSP